MSQRQVFNFKNGSNVQVGDDNKMGLRHANSDGIIHITNHGSMTMNINIQPAAPDRPYDSVGSAEYQSASYVSADSSSRTYSEDDIKAPKTCKGENKGRLAKPDCRYCSSPNSCEIPLNTTVDSKNYVHFQTCSTNPDSEPGEMRGDNSDFDPGENHGDNFNFDPEENHRDNSDFDPGENHGDNSDFDPGETHDDIFDIDETFVRTLEEPLESRRVQENDGNRNYENFILLDKQEEYEVTSVKKQYCDESIPVFKLEPTPSDFTVYLKHADGNRSQPRLIPVQVSPQTTLSHIKTIFHSLFGCRGKIRYTVTDGAVVHSRQLQDDSGNLQDNRIKNGSVIYFGIDKKYEKIYEEILYMRNPSEDKPFCRCSDLWY